MCCNDPEYLMRTQSSGGRGHGSQDPWATHFGIESTFTFGTDHIYISVRERHHVTSRGTFLFLIVASARLKMLSARD